jgi:hypothetical protein
MGEEEWEARIKKSVTLLAYISIANMIEFMVVESQRVMHGTYHEDDWFFYHDALFLMTARSTIESMQKKITWKGGCFQSTSSAAMTKTWNCFRPSNQQLSQNDALLGLLPQQGLEGCSHATHVLHVSLARRWQPQVFLVDSQTWLLVGLLPNPGAWRWLSIQQANPPGYREGLPIDAADLPGEGCPDRGDGWPERQTGPSTACIRHQQAWQEEGPSAWEGRGALDSWSACTASLWGLKLETSIAVHAGNKENQPPHSDAHVGEGEGEDCL